MTERPVMKAVMPLPLIVIGFIMDHGPHPQMLDLDTLEVL